MKVLSALAASLLLLAGLGGCSPEQKELRRLVSPGQKLVAVLMESLTGGAVHEDIYVNDQGIPLNLDKPVFSAVGCDRLSFEWANDYTLQIHYETTCVINQFTNRWSRPSDVAVGRANPIEIVFELNATDREENMPKMSERERVTALEEKLKQLKAQQQRKEARARTIEARRSRREEARRKFLVGAIVLAKVETGEIEETTLKQWLSPRPHEGGGSGVVWTG